MIFSAYRFIIPLIASHVIVDFLFQTDDAARNKSRFAVLLRHSIQLGVVTYILTGITGAWGIALLFLLTHLVIDAIKSRTGEDNFRVFLFDQVAHLMALLLIALGAHCLSLWLYPGIWFGLFGMDYYRFLLIITGVIVATRAGAIFIRLALKAIDLDPDAERGDEGIRSIPKGGRVIGYLERALIYLFILVGQPGAIGFLIAAKSIFRFGETSQAGQRKEAEYVIIGTLSSFLFGLVVVYAVRYYLSRL